MLYEQHSSAFLTDLTEVISVQCNVLITAGDSVNTRNKQTMDFRSYLGFVSLREVYKFPQRLRANLSFKPLPHENIGVMWRVY